MYAEDLAQTYTGSMIVSLVSVSPYEHNLVVSVACGTVVSLTPPSDPYNHSSHRPQDCPSSPSNLARDLCICSNQLLNKPSMIMIAQCSCLWVSHIMIRNHFSNTFALSFFFFLSFVCFYLSLFQVLFGSILGLWSIQPQYSGRSGSVKFCATFIPA